MKNSTKLFTSIFTCGAITLGYLSSVSAHEGSHIIVSGDDTIRVYQKNNNGNTNYVVNGKEFTWNDLSEDQQSRIKAVESKLAIAEKKLAKQEIAIKKITSQMEEKAELLEKEARKIEQAFVKVSKHKMNFNDLEKAMRELELSTRANEIALRAKELELDKLDDKLEAIDLSMVEEIEQHADEYEAVLMEIAKELD
ncbi:hypothetical protein HII17_06160 [Thalassotalea sp. M1531]|uniref:Uncharacterized protein n=1 Tax=Thalassotalea algicola TaxID=2716224 RepID=A0A7Y0Q693_9GAMM|nr:hypothetical protein [Thalassotalea algicola]NMP31143.1 hypothetical protein [Thalassotalea algicola]